MWKIIYEKCLWESYYFKGGKEKIKNPCAQTRTGDLPGSIEHFGFSGFTVIRRGISTLVWFLYHIFNYSQALYHWATKGFPLSNTLYLDKGIINKNKLFLKLLIKQILSELPCFPPIVCKKQIFQNILSISIILK